MALKDNKFYLMWFKDAWPYLTGAVLLSAFQVFTLASTGRSMGCFRGSWPTWGAWLYEAVGGTVDKWYYFASEGAQKTLENGFLNHSGKYAEYRNHTRCAFCYPDGFTV